MDEGSSANIRLPSIGDVPTSPVGGGYDPFAQAPLTELVSNNDTKYTNDDGGNNNGGIPLSGEGMGESAKNTGVFDDFNNWDDDDKKEDGNNVGGETSGADGENKDSEQEGNGDSSENKGREYEAFPDQVPEVPTFGIPQEPKPREYEQFPIGEDGAEGDGDGNNDLEKGNGGPTDTSVPVEKSKGKSGVNHLIFLIVIWIIVFFTDLYPLLIVCLLWRKSPNRTVRILSMMSGVVGFVMTLLVILSVIGAGLTAFVLLNLLCCVGIIVVIVVVVVVAA